MRRLSRVARTIAVAGTLTAGIVGCSSGGGGPGDGTAGNVGPGRGGQGAGGIAGATGGGSGTSGAAGGANGGASGATGIVYRPLCTTDGWCWEHPLPQGNALRAVHGSGPNDVWAVGDRGTILHFDGAAWSPVPSGVLDRLTGVWAASPSEAWISGTNGALLRWDGAVWAPAGQPSTLTTADAVTGWVDTAGGAARSTVWFANGSSPAKVTGGTWSRDPAASPSFGILALWADATGGLWAAGVGGAFGVLRGLAWTRLGTGGTSRMQGIGGDPAGNVWVVSDFSEIVRVDPRGVTSMFTSRASGALHAVRAFAANDAWIAGAAGTLLHFDGASWQARASGTSFDLYGIWGATPSDVWVVGDRGTMIHCNGSSCSPPNGVTTAELSAVWAASADEAWAVGRAGTILHRVSGRWQSVPSPTTRNLTAVWGSSATDVWMGGDGAVLRWNGSQLTAATEPAAGVVALSGRAANDLWAVSGGAAVHWDGAAWTPVPVARPVALSIFGAAPDEIWVASIDGAATAGRWNGQAWTTFPLADCLRLHGSGPGDVWCVGGIQGPRMSRWDGTMWTGVTVPADAGLNAVASGGPGSVWYVGVSGVLGRCTGTTCEGRASNAPVARRVFLDDTLNAVATSGDHVYAAGRRGVILHRSP
jgi:hypothetical protein